MLRPIVSAIALLLLSACGNNDDSHPLPETSGENEVNPQPALINYQLINIYPHDSTAYTEGLQWVDGKFLESTGQYGQSDIRYSDLATGKVLQKTTLSQNFFGEGCSLINGKVFQMTYRENKCLVYDPSTLQKTGEFDYSFGEGWGMTTNGRELIISNGSSNIYFYDPVSFKEIKRIGVTNQYGPVGNLNELELIKGFLYANVWRADHILKIDTSNGRVVGILDFSDLRSKIGLPLLSDMEDTGLPEVLNGIAYDAANDRIFVTGKYWPKLCEVKFTN